MTFRLAWATDIHLDIAGSEAASEFVDEVNLTGVNALLIGGDISNYDMLQGHLALLATGINVPIYFVLGNHDAYRGSIYDSKCLAREAVEDHRNLCFLEHFGLVNLTEKTFLVGVGGWADARTGDFLLAPTLLNDYTLIRELQYLPSLIARDVLRELGDAAADRLRELLARVPACCEQLIVLMHVPAWRDVCWYGGRISDDKWAPHFTCVAAGEVIEEFAAGRPDLDLLVLSGHTHGGGVTQIAENITAKSGAAEYGIPMIVEILSVD